MRAESIRIHNFRSFADETIALSPYSILVGANNSGKSNVIEAIRVFYEKDTKFDESRDIPKFAQDADSWIEIQYNLTEDEYAQLREEYRQPDSTLRVRKYLRTKEVGDDGKPKSGIYGYVGGNVCNSRFYGEKNVQQGKLGEIIYIPAVSKLDEHTKVTGPSALRDLVNRILGKIAASSQSYDDLVEAFSAFRDGIKLEKTADGRSLNALEDEISREISEWGTSFQFTVNPIPPNDIVKNLIGHVIRDEALDADMPASLFGQGFQRHLIFTLVKLDAKYASVPAARSGKEFSPTLTWLLFEEPEAYLHPSQIDVLNESLRTLSQDDCSQVLITTHSPQFVSKNIEDLPALVRLHREDTKSRVGQVSGTDLERILGTNQDCLLEWRNSGIQVSDEDMEMDMEMVKYCLWLNPLRCSAFFANLVLLVEGPTETALLGHMLDTGKISCPNGGVFLVDTMGKWNTHRFMNLFSALGIPHSVLCDYDARTAQNEVIRLTMERLRNPFTKSIDSFDCDLESFLKIDPLPRSQHYRKPQYVMWHLGQGKIPDGRLAALADKVSALLC